MGDRLAGRVAVLELGHDGIRVNSGEPGEVSSLVVFLASDESASITGTEHVIVGGQGL
jgi:NAD(P)-dependent dehydrogenase (short-subunit alcohol dehydrogenase family)